MKQSPLHRRPSPRFRRQAGRAHQALMSSTTWDTGLLLSFLPCALVNAGLLALMMWWRWRRTTAKLPAEPGAKAPSAATDGEGWANIRLGRRVRVLSRTRIGRGFPLLVRV
jgi:hypothetical protein